MPNSATRALRFTIDYLLLVVYCQFPIQRYKKSLSLTHISKQQFDRPSFLGSQFIFALLKKEGNKPKQAKNGYFLKKLGIFNFFPNFS
jgi:hypothetical protein